MSNKTKILLVEDDANICSAMTRVLKSVGYHVREASSAKECMVELRANIPDLLLMDVGLPDGDGCQLCSQIKADPHLQGIFVVLLSGIKTSSNDQVTGPSLGADGVIARPVSNEELLARVQAMDRTRLAEKALQEAHDALEVRVRERTAELAKVNEQLQIEVKERQRKESILRETLQRLNEAERVGNFGYRVHDVKTGGEWWSENEYAIYGLPKNVKPSYDLYLDCVHPDERAIHDRRFKDGWESDSAWHSFEYRIVRRDGEIRNISARYRFERDSQGNPLRALGTDQDITDQKISEKILAQSRDYNRAILMSMKDHIVVLDQAGQILSANNSWFEFARKNDVSSLNLIGEGANYLDVCRRASDGTDETAQKALGGIQAVLTGSRDHFALEYPCHSPSTQRWFLMNVIPFKGENGGAVVSHTDISLRKKAEDSLVESQKEARLLTRKLLKAQESERALLARELHDDITQRLAILNIEVDELEMKHPSLSRSLKNKLRKIGNDLGALSYDVHMISRQLHPSILYDLGLVKAVKIESNNFSRIYGIAPTLNLDSTIQDVPSETAICMYRILQEGLKNIGKHARATHVQVRLYKKNDFICLSLRDNGIGFELDSSVEAAGIGLASMTERARMINADFSIESGAGKGTTIKLKTPFTSNQD